MSAHLPKLVLSVKTAGRGVGGGGAPGSWVREGYPHQGKHWNVSLTFASSFITLHFQGSGGRAGLQAQGVQLQE